MYCPPPSLENIDIIDEEVVWLGYAWDFYGHFLSDSLSRLWFFLKEKNLKACYISNGDTFLEGYRLFGLSDNQLIRITKPTKFKNIIIPDISFAFYDFFYPEYKKTIDKMVQNVPSAGIEKVYLSRAKCGNTFGEKLLEDIFEKEGFKVFYPETLNIKEKISILKDAKVVAGTSGTGMHNVLFAPDGIRCISFNRSNCILGMQCAIDEMKDLDAVYVDVYQNILPVGIAAQPYLIGVTKELLKFLSDNNIYFRYKNGRFKNFYYKDFSKDLFYFMNLWAEINEKEESTLPEYVSRKVIAKCIRDVFDMYELYMLTRTKKTIRDKVLSLLK